jgi:hypothetical protein
MKWPAELLLIRHAESAYNNLKKQKDADPDYCRFRTSLENDPSHPEVQPMAGRNASTRVVMRRHGS